ncbi:MAG: hypothetical protein M3546_10225 [Actinomycetota bacterium]|nr:hypothetical protein [Actinomycetota bacterium]
MTVFAVASHAFVDPTGGQQLIPEVLVRLGYGSGRGASVRARSKVPPGVRRLVHKVLPRGATQTLQARAGTLPNPLDSPLTRAAALDGDRCSWIRLNLDGREPHGAVEPRAEADGILADIRAELLVLEHPHTGARIVRQVQSAAEAFGADHHPDVPDLIVDFRIDLGMLDACRSSRVGLFAFRTRRRPGDAVPIHRFPPGSGSPAPTSRGLPLRVKEGRSISRRRSSRSSASPSLIGSKERR